MSQASVLSSIRCSVSLTPTGHLVTARDDQAFGYPVPARSAERIEAAFARGWGHGLLHLALAEVGEDLGLTLGYWRDIAKLYLTKLRGILDLNAAFAAGLKLPLEPFEAEGFHSSAPPMLGLEYLDAEVVRAAWDALEQALLDDARSSVEDPEAFLKARSPLWSSVGRVFFHLAENKARPDRPFAFLATYTARLSSHGKLQHVPLGQALREQAAAANKQALLALLVPVQKAAEKSSFLKEMVDTTRVFQPQAWSPAEAYRFLRDVPLFEDAGIFVRVPDWWKPRSPPRLRVGVTVGDAPAAGVGADAILDFSVELALDGEPVSEAEWRQVLAGTGNLALVKGRWVEVDRDKLADVLRHWKAVEKEARRGGITFHAGMRLLAGLPAETTPAGSDSASLSDPAAEWLSVEAGDWLHGALEELRSPSSLEVRFSEDELRAELRPYQARGVKWLHLLHKLRLGGCLADDMGLGKTLQVLGLLVLLRREAREDRERRPSLLVLPASLIGNWKAECARFTPGLRLLIAHPSEQEAPREGAPPGLEAADLVVTTYGMLARQPWLREVEWNVVVLDEAQAIKNPGARQTQAVKALRSRHRLALTGTPVENRLGDLWSIFDFLSPGLLGGAKEFARLTRGADRSAMEVYGQVRALVRPYLLRRLKTDRRIIADLPDKQEVKAFCGLKKAQAALYQQSVEELARSLETADGIRRRGIILSYILRLKQICNHPSQWTGDGAYDPAESGKTARLAEICEEVAGRQEKVLVFTQFKEITGMLAGLLERVFGRRGLVLDGDTPVRKRRDLVEEFQREDGPPFFVLSLKAGGIGLNLTAATHVVHFDRWWNPAVENQATDRAYRIGQKRSVLVHKFVCRGTVEERIDALLESKRTMAEEVLKDGAEAVLTEMSNEDLMRFVSLDKNKAATEA